MLSQTGIPPPRSHPSAAASQGWLGPEDASERLKGVWVLLNSVFPSLLKNPQTYAKALCCHSSSVKCCLIFCTTSMVHIFSPPGTKGAEAPERRWPEAAAHLWNPEAVWRKDLKGPVSPPHVYPPLEIK